MALAAVRRQPKCPGRRVASAIDNLPGAADESAMTDETDDILNRLPARLKEARRAQGPTTEST